jgi:antirestriction protein ArdC
MRTLETILAERLLNPLAQGLVSWREGWPSGLPRSLTADREFRGLNLLLLAGSRFASRYWLTAGELSQLGGIVKPGQEPTPVFGKAAGLTEVVEVFNLDQVDGVPRPEADGPIPTARGLALAGQVLEVMPAKPEIAHRREEAPGYDPQRDRLTLPHLSQLRDGTEYFAHLFRGMVRATGHPQRLHRTDARMEPLVVALGTAFLCGFAGLRQGEPADVDQQTAGAVEPRQLVRAAAAAQRAVEFVRGKHCLPPRSSTETVPGCSYQI